MWRTDSLENTMCWERLKAGGEGDNRGWDGWMASPTRQDSEQAPGVGDGQGSLACCSPWGKELDTTEWLNWTECKLLQSRDSVFCMFSIVLESESEAAQSCPTLCDPMDTRLCPRDFLGKSTGVGCHFLLQRIFPTQGSNPGLQHCRQTLYHLSHQGNPYDSGKQSVLMLRVRNWNLPPPQKEAFL